MRAAVDRAIALGPDFLAGKVEATRMAESMVTAVRGYIEHAGDGIPHGAEATELHETLRELMGCGSGFLAGRCDAACVARTMTYMVGEYGQKAH